MSNSKTEDLEVSANYPYEGDFVHDTVRVYKRRWLVLLLFILVSGCNAYHWIQYCIIGNIIMRYYGVSAQVVDYTSIVYLITYLPLVIPASYITDRKGLRYITVVAALGNCIGAWLKVCSVPPGNFWYGFAGQSVMSCMQLFILSTPSHLAAKWFGPDQVSTASSLGVFGSQVGVSFGFFITPIVVRDHPNVLDIGNDLHALFIVLAIISTVVLIGVVIFFEKEPPLPPSRTQLILRQSAGPVFSNKNFFKSFKRLLTNFPFWMLLIAYGISIGLYNTVSPFLNPIILNYFPGDTILAGKVGTLLVITGIPGSISFGYILDKSRKYKATIFVIYLMSAVGMASFTFCLPTKSETLVYLSATVLGFFFTGYIATGFEMAAELTYPEMESSSSGLLNSMAQMGGVFFTLIFGEIIRYGGVFYATLGITLCLCVGVIITALTPNVHKRQDALDSQPYEYKPTPVIVN